MARYIEIDKAIPLMIQACADIVGHGITQVDAVRIAEILEDASTDDVVEVVRCKDCIHWGGVTYGFVCRKLSGIETKICMGADHFCSYGERSRQ
jgi:hypothetical protein